MSETLVKHIFKIQKKFFVAGGLLLLFLIGLFHDLLTRILR